MSGKELSEDAERKMKDSDQLYRESFRKSSAAKLLIDPETSEIRREPRRLEVLRLRARATRG